MSRFFKSKLLWAFPYKRSLLHFIIRLIFYRFSAYKLVCLTIKHFIFSLYIAKFLLIIVSSQ
jgi:hypothetical protein